MSARDRVTVWPIDAWARREAGDGHLYWTRLDLLGLVPANFEHVGWVQQGDARGPLLRARTTGRLVMQASPGSIRSVDERKVRAALGALASNPSI